MGCCAARPATASPRGHNVHTLSRGDLDSMGCTPLSLISLADVWLRRGEPIELPKAQSRRERVSIQRLTGQLSLVH